MITQHLSTTRQRGGTASELAYYQLGVKCNKAYLVDLKLPDKCPDILLCYGTAQMPTIPFNLYMVMLVPRKNLKYSLPLTRLHIPA